MDRNSTKHIRAGGWPFLGLCGSFTVDWPTSNRSVIRNSHSAIVLPTQSAYAVFSILLPLRPIWPGFAINTVFYAGLLWLLFAAPFAFRRWRRIKRGLCPKCAYPVGDSPVCTECGAAVSLSLRGRERARVREP
jgi:hypothetical protein